jgi:hypothetical protein
LAVEICHQVNRTLTDLDISCNGLGIQGTTAISKALQVAGCSFLNE